MEPFVIGFIVAGSILGTFACFITTGCERMVGIVYDFYQCIRSTQPTVHPQVEQS
jgi:hypothetical protein